MTLLFTTLCAWLDAGLPVAVATVAGQTGSAPRTSGAKLLLAGDGRLCGSVGGGLLEAETLKAARAVLAEPGAQPRLLVFDLSGELAAGADMICGGHVDVVVERVDPGPGALVFHALRDLLAAGRSCLLATPLSGAQRLLAAPWPPPGGETRGTARCDPADDHRQGAATPRADTPVRAPAPAAWPVADPERIAGLFGPGAVGMRAAGLARTPEGDWLLEPVSAPRPLVLAGAGHVSRATAHTAALCGFRVIVLDDRPEFANRERFPEADAVFVRPLDNCLADLNLGPEAFVAVLTRGHVHDASVLAQALRSRAGYVGMIGSARKREAVYDKLHAQGFSRAELARVFCPIGLDIEAQTPEEIAVSIVAQLIAVRAGGQTA